jgi:hypothetical protein
MTPHDALIAEVREMSVRFRRTGDAYPCYGHNQYRQDADRLEAFADAFEAEIEQAVANNALWAALHRQAERERDEALKDASYHSDCRPNRRQAEAAIADAKAMNDKWADEYARAEAAEAKLRELEQERDEWKERANDEVTKFGHYELDLFAIGELVGSDALDARLVHAVRALKERYEARIAELEAERDAYQAGVQTWQAAYTTLDASHVSDQDKERAIEAAVMCGRSFSNAIMFNSRQEQDFGMAKRAEARTLLKLRTDTP